MRTHRLPWWSLMAAGFLAALASRGPAVSGEARPGDEVSQLDPKGKIHIPIGIPDTLDALKTFVEAEGSFSPGFGSYGIYFWVFDRRKQELTAPTMDFVQCRRGLTHVSAAGSCSVACLIPWTSWDFGERSVQTVLSHVRLSSPAGQVFVVGASARVGSKAAPRGVSGPMSLYVALRPLGPAGGPVRKLEVSEDGDALLVDGHPAIVALKRPSAAGVLETDTVGALALEGKMPSARVATSSDGRCSGALRFDFDELSRDGEQVDLMCPVLPGRRAVPHRWDRKSEWAQLDEAVPNPPEGGLLQPDPGLEYYRNLDGEALRGAAADYWGHLLEKVCLELPDRRWGECFAVAAAHLALCMNEGAPDVAVANYNVFNRDGVYVANVFDKAGAHELAAKAIDHMLQHPFSGRVYPEADNPGQILWAAAEHWFLTRDEDWLSRAYPSIRKLGALIEYLHAGPGPHWVSMDRLEYGEALPPEERKELKPGQCDGFHPEYTEAFDIAGLRGAAKLAEGTGETLDAAAWTALSEKLFKAYDDRFGAGPFGPLLPREYGSYCVLWPCRLYPLDAGKAFNQFKGIGAKAPDGWRYFPLATAHQGLLAGNREAGHGTLEAHFADEQCRGWYAFDEGGASGPGGWRHVLTRWNPGVAMPHGWATAELFLLLRDSVVFEDGPRLVLLAGVPPSWLSGKEGFRVTGLPTHHGAFSLLWRRTEDGALLFLTGSASPPGGYILRWPAGLEANITVGGQPAARTEGGDILLPAGTREVRFVE